MSLVVGAAAHGSPGVSTAMQMVAALWSESSAVPVVVEADATGGVLAARFELSLTPGLVTLAESLRKSEAPAVLEHAQRLPSGIACVTISPSSTAASAQLRSVGPYLGPYLRECGHPVLLDAGTVTPDGKAIATITMADLLLWFVRPTREELLVLRHRLVECPQPENVAIVLVGDTPYNAEQVSEAMDVEVLHTLPVDRRAATAANHGGDDRFLRKSQLARSCGQLVERILERIGPQAKPATAQAMPPAPPKADTTDAEELPSVPDVPDQAPLPPVPDIPDDLAVDDRPRPPAPPEFADDPSDMAFDPDDEDDITLPPHLIERRNRESEASSATPPTAPPPPSGPGIDDDTGNDWQDSDETPPVDDDPGLVVWVNKN